MAKNGTCDNCKFWKVNVEHKQQGICQGPSKMNNGMTTTSKFTCPKHLEELRKLNK